MDKAMAITRRPSNPEAEDEPSQKLQNASECDSLSTSRKRKLEGDEEQIVLSPDVLASMTRSERKRHRERKRRSDVNKGFDDLMALLIEIDPVVRAEADDRARRGQLKGNLGTQEEILLSRVELIGRTVEVLRRIHTENEQRKCIIDQILQQRKTSVVPRIFNLPSTGLAQQATQRSFAALAAFPGLRSDQASAALPSSMLSPLLQQHLDGSPIGPLPPVDLVGFGNAQLQTFPSFVGAPSPFASGPSASLVNRLAAAERDQTAAALAQAMKYSSGQPRQDLR